MPPDYGGPLPDSGFLSKPADAKDGNWIQTTPGKGWFTLLRLYSPEESFFTKQWRPSEIERMP